jgi:hypothetical protein
LKERLETVIVSGVISSRARVIVAKIAPNTLRKSFDVMLQKKLPNSKATALIKMLASKVKTTIA